MKAELEDVFIIEPDIKNDVAVDESESTTWAVLPVALVSSLERQKLALFC